MATTAEMEKRILDLEAEVQRLRAGNPSDELTALDQSHYAWAANVANNSHDESRQNGVAATVNLTYKPVFADKTRLRKRIEERDKKTGFVVDPEATPQRARELMIQQGIRPEDNSFSSEIVRMRDRE